MRSPRPIPRSLGAALTVTAVIAIVGIAEIARAQALQDISLPAARMTGGKPLMEALKSRRSARVFSAQRLPLQTLGDLLWAGAGINRPESGKRTAPSARNWQEIEVYAILQEGAYLYDAGAHTLKGVAGGDLRKLTGTQDFVATAPLNLVYVADLTKMKDAAPENEGMYTGADAAFMAENVYLFCASEGLATVVRASLDRKALAEALKLPERKKVILAQTVGFPGTESPAPGQDKK